MGKEWRGAALALTTAMFWGALPVALKQLLAVMDPATIVWFRFLAAALWLWLMGLPGHGATHAPQQHGRFRLPDMRRCVLVGVAVLGLGGNFVLFNASVEYLSPAGSQVLAQLGPMLLMLGSVVVLGEPLRRAQIWGIVLLLIGFVLFFYERILELGTGRPGVDGVGLGLLLGFGAGAVWAAYGLAQKVLLREVAPGRLMRWIYTWCAIALFWAASPGNIRQLDAVQWACLAFCCLNTLVAYGAFSKAMACWHTAKVGALVTLTPLFTLAFSAMLHTLAPDVFAGESLGPRNWLGAVIVVAGAGLIAVGPLIHWQRRPCAGERPVP